MDKLICPECNCKLVKLIDYKNKYGCTYCEAEWKLEGSDFIKAANGIIIQDDMLQKVKFSDNKLEAIRDRIQDELTLTGKNKGDTRSRELDISSIPLEKAELPDTNKN